MSSEKYIGLDVHQATISVAVLDSTGKLVMESILETKAATILEFFAGLRGTVSVTFEEGTWAAWLYDVMKPASVAEPNDSISNWTCCSTCASKRAASCWRRVASMPSPSNYGRFPHWGRFAQPWRWR